MLSTNSKKLLKPMSNEANDSFLSEALRNFVDAIKEKLEPDFGRVSSRKEKREVKKRIAEQLRVEKEYQQNVFLAVNEDLKNGTHAARDARAAVERHYEELLEKGKIREDIEDSNPDDESVFREVNRQLLEDGSTEG